MKSIITNDLSTCYVCGRTPVQIHHCIFGSAGRRLSDSDGLIVPLCLEHHTGSKNGVHGQNYALCVALKRQAQKSFEERYGHDKWMERYGRNYLD